MDVAREPRGFGRLMDEAACATGSHGDDLFPTAEEAERAGREAALKRVAELEAELKRRG